MKKVVAGTIIAAAVAAVCAAFAYIERQKISDMYAKTIAAWNNWRA